MESLYLLIPLSVVLVFIIGVLFWWSLRDGQYDDLEGPAYRLLMDDKDELPPSSGAASTADEPRQSADEGRAEPESRHKAHDV
ncbi:cbb3-type cytochrome oxidase assembly protein CcoS [Azoarcus sp. L1K30]|uniref:cbb3-type cytochrome oxidase assembly protein CcoS n=1 Tax=Azoarcus sp. L1K30 TaxID=2820277 RepID=UPI001B82E478|nr:cbb3-type cytochrome oxidase assembly protein CcoS [Azoarcus sp. L1K30]